MTAKHLARLVVAVGLAVLAGAPAAVADADRAVAEAREAAQRDQNSRAAAAFESALLEDPSRRYEWLRESFRTRERRACGLIGVGRSSYRYQRCKKGDPILRRRLRQLAAVRPHFGYRPLWVMLRREGWLVGEPQADLSAVSGRRAHGARKAAPLRE